jgi:5-methylcytosine-specific restriction protein A
MNRNSKTIQRIRGRTLQMLRERLLRANPLCVSCTSKGYVTAATELDHIKALCNGGTNDDSNLQGLCKTCHEDKTAADLGHKVKVTVGVDGWPLA